MITVLVSLEQAQVETLAVEPVGLPHPVLVLQDTQRAEEENQPKGI